MVGGSLATAGALALAALLASRRPGLWLAGTLGAAGALFAAAVAVLAGGAPWDWRSTAAVGGAPFHLRLDAICAVFLALLAVVGGCGAAYTRQYWTDREHPRSAPRGRAWWIALVACMGFTLLAANGLHFLLGWELFTVCAYFLITLDTRRRAVRRAGWLYLGASHAATVALFAFFALLADRTGGWDFAAWRDRADLAPLFWLALFGFGLKAGIFGLHIWLPSAHASAPSHVSAILSGVSIKLGLYGLLRFSGLLPVPAAAGWVVIGLGALSALFGIAFAFAQNDLKRLLAYCSVENVGIILIGFGGALLAAASDHAAWGRLALAGALLHVWNHGLFKALLFLGAGSVLHAARTREISRLGGLWPRMPWTAAFFALGAAAVSGLPPLNGFVSEWLIYLGLFDAVGSRAPAAWAALPVVILLAASGALALATFAKAGALVFCGAPRTQPAARAHESGPWMLGPMAVLAAGCVLAALAPFVLWPAVDRAVAAWQPAWAAAAAPAPLRPLAVAQVVLAVAATVAAAALWRRLARGAPRRAVTWDCGYAAPTARMQYSGGSFAGIAGGWFGWLLQPLRALQRPRGPLPESARLVERVPETVLEHGLGPAAAAVLRLSTAVRRLQHGRLQAYILYLVLGLLALGFLIFLGGTT